MMSKCHVVWAAVAFAVAANLGGCGKTQDPHEVIAKVEQLRKKGHNNTAIIDLKNILQKDGLNAEARYWLGVTYFDAMAYQLAEQELRRALELNYERSKVMPLLGRTMLMRDEFQRVLDNIPLESHLSASVQADILTLRARALMGLNQIKQAREVLNAALGKEPEFADALLVLAQLAGKDGQFDESSRLIEKAIARSPNNVDAWLMKGDLARLNKDSAGQLAANQKAIEVEPSNVTARLNIASIEIMNNRRDEARKLIAEARKLAPSSVSAIHMQALAQYYSREFNAARDSVQQILKVAPDYSPSVFLAGAINLELGSYEQAQMNLWRILDRNPENLAARQLLAVTLARSGQIQRAIEMIQPPLNQGVNDSRLLLLAGELYLYAGEFTKASQYFEQASKQDPQNADWRTKLGLSRLAFGDTQRGFADLESAIALDPEKYESDVVLITSYLRKGDYPQALAAVERLERKQPKNPLTFNLKGLIYLGKKETPAAKKYFERALDLQPTFLAAAINLAKLDLKEQNLKSARRRIEAIAEKDKRSAQALLALAEMGSQLGATVDERVKWLDQASKLEPRSSRIQLAVSRLFLQMGNERRALELAQQAVAINPEDPVTLDALAIMQLSVGHKDQAIVTYSKLVNVQPNSPSALVRLAKAHVSNADPKAAIAALKKALALQPDFIDAQVTLAQLELGASRFTEGLAVARQLQKQHPKSPVGFVVEGDILLSQKKYPEAIKQLEAVHSVFKSPQSAIKLHAAYAVAGQVKQGDVRLADWLKQVPEDVVARSYAADSFLRRGEYSQAATYYEQLLKIQSDNWVVLNNLAWTYYYLKDKRALEKAEAAYKLKSDDASVMDTFGWILVEQGSVDRGIEMLQKAAKAAPRMSSVHYHLAKAWLKTGQKEKARNELNDALARNQPFADRDEAVKLLKQLGN